MAEEASLEHEKFKVFLLVLWYIFYPVGIVLYYILVSILFIFQQLYRPVSFLAQPLVYIGRFIGACVLAPFQLLVKLETLYIFLSVAAIVGITGGLAGALISGSLNHLLGLDSVESPKASRSAKEYRETRRKAKEPNKGPYTLTDALSPKSPVSPDSIQAGYFSHSDGSRKGRRSRSLLDQTILEEDDSDF